MDKPFPAYQGDEPFVFVCYSHEDTDVVYPEIGWLQEQGLNVWYDEGISAGRVWRAEIAQAIDACSSVLYYVSKSSLDSAHCNREINLALDQEKTILPIYLNDVKLTDDLRVGLSRVQALHRDNDANYQQHLLNALGRTNIVDESPVVSQQHNQTQDSMPTLFDPSIAVLPFRTSSSDPGVRALADGLVDELVNELSGPRLKNLRRHPLLKRYGLKVVPVTSTRRYWNTDENPASIGKSLGVAYLVDGSVRPGDGLLRVTLQLIRAADNEQVWSQTYDRAPGDPLAVQADVARDAAWSVTATIPFDYWYRSLRTQFTDGAAHHYFVRANRGAIQYYRGDDVDLVAVAKNYEKVLELEPEFAQTYGFLIVTYLQLMASIEPIEPVATIDTLLTQLSGLVDSGADAPANSLSLLWAWYSLLQLDYVDANRYLRQALNEKPNDFAAHLVQGWLWVHRGDLDQALASFRRTVEEEGGSPSVVRQHARALRASGQQSEAVEVIERALDLVPGDYGKGRLLLDQAGAYATLGELERATKLVDQAWTLCGSQHLEIFPAALATTGRFDRALAIVRKLEAEGSSRGLNPVDVIDGYVALDDLDSAFRWINKGIDARHFEVVTWMHYSRTDQRLVDDPRWQQAWSRLPEVPQV